VLKPIPGERIGRWLATIVILLIAAMQIISVFRGGKSDAVAEGPTKVSAQEVIAGKIVLAKNVLGKLAPTPVPQDELEQLAKSAQTLAGFGTTHQFKRASCRTSCHRPSSLASLASRPDAHQGGFGAF
jgi:hypothetical protein